MGLFDRFKKPLPEVPVGPQIEAQVDARVHAMTERSDIEGPVVELRDLVQVDLFGVGADFVDQLGVPRLELASELLLHGLVGAQLALEEHVDRDAASALLDPYHRALAHHVASGQRERFDQGPVPVLHAGEKINDGADDSSREPRYVVLGLLPRRLHTANRRGASEGLIRMALLSQLGGYGLGDLIWERRPDALEA